MRYFLRRLSIFIILLSFIFLGGGAIVSYIESGNILPKVYLIGLNDSEVSISTVNNEGAKGITSSKDTNDINKTSNNNVSNNNVINNNVNSGNSSNSVGNSTEVVDNNQNTTPTPVEPSTPVEETPSTGAVDESVTTEEVVVDPNETIRNTIENKYGLSIKYGKETEGYMVDTLSTFPITDENEINKALLDMQSTISLFPEDLFWELKNNGYPLTIYLIKNYSIENVTGITESYSNRVNISIATNFSFGETFNHEVYHYLENFITKFKGASYSSWNTLNLSNFTYGSVRSDLSYNRTYSEDAYFVNNYAQTSANEDRASTFEYMMFTNKASCLNANKPVWKKAKFMSQLLEKYLESVKPEVTEYWERHL